MQRKFPVTVIQFTKHVAWHLLRPFQRIFLDKMPLQTVDNYDAYWNARGPLPLLYRHKYVAANLPATGRVLDVGCGDGTFLKLLHAQKPELELVGLDISSVAINKLKESGISGFVHDIGAQQLPVEIRADYVVVMEMLEHVSNPEFVMKSLLSTGANRFYVTIPNLGYIEHRLRLSLAGKMPITSIIFHIDEHLRFWTVSDFKYWADFMGFKVVKAIGQRGVPVLWQILPSLFASQMIYILERE